MTFDQMPEAVNRLQMEVAEIKRLLLNNQAPATSPADEPALDINQAAEVLGIAKQTVYQNVSKIPHKKKHGRLYFFRSELLTYLNTGNQQTI